MKSKLTKKYESIGICLNELQRSTRRKSSEDDQSYHAGLLLILLASVFSIFVVMNPNNFFQSTHRHQSAYPFLSFGPLRTGRSLQFPELVHHCLLNRVNGIEEFLLGCEKI